MFDMLQITEWAEEDAANWHMQGYASPQNVEICYRRFFIGKFRAEYLLDWIPEGPEKLFLEVDLLDWNPKDNPEEVFLETDEYMGSQESINVALRLSVVDELDC